MKKIFFTIMIILLIIPYFLKSQTTGTFTDKRDGQVYKTVAIGSQIWMAENLNYQTSDSWCYDNNLSNCDVYGRLYNWDAAVRACPSGWRLPSESEWTKVSNYLGLGGAEVAGGKMKEAGTSHWNLPNTGASNSSGFNALPGGNRISIGLLFYEVGNDGYWWSSSEYSGTAAFCRNLNYGDDQVHGGYTDKARGFSVRCLKN